MTDKKTHAAMISKFSKRLRHIQDQFYEVVLAYFELHRKQPNFVGFFSLQYVKLRMLVF